jgi:hypothetical protein
VGYLVNNELEIMRKRAAMVDLRYYPGRSLEEQRTLPKHSGRTIDVPADIEPVISSSYLETLNKRYEHLKQPVPQIIYIQITPYAL